MASSIPSAQTQTSQADAQAACDYTDRRCPRHEDTPRPGSAAHFLARGWQLRGHSTMTLADAQLVADAAVARWPGLAPTKALATDLESNFAQLTGDPVAPAIAEALARPYGDGPLTRQRLRAYVGARVLASLEPFAIPQERLAQAFEVSQPTISLEVRWLTKQGGIALSQPAWQHKRRAALYHPGPHFERVIAPAPF